MPSNGRARVRTGSAGKESSIYTAGSVRLGRSEATATSSMTTWQDSFHTDEFPAAWERILQRHVPILGYLSEPDQRELRSYIRWFVGSKNFEGCAGLTITDEIRVVVAAQACLLLLHRDTPCYERLRLIRIYPGTHFAISSVEKLGGESWIDGIVLLAWDSVRYGAANPFDGYNIVLHEFAHQLDYEDGECDGTPLLDRVSLGPNASGRVREISGRYRQGHRPGPSVLWRQKSGGIFRRRH